jgi:hypothetical protein
MNRRNNPSNPQLVAVLPSKPLAAGRTLEEIMRSRLTYQLQTKYTLLVLLNEAQKTLVDKQDQLSKLLKHRDKRQPPPVESLPILAELNEEIRVLRTVMSSQTAEYRALSFNPELQAFEKNAVLREQAVRGLQQRFVAVDLPYAVPPKPLAEECRPGFFFAISPPVSVLMQQKKKAPAVVAAARIEQPKLGLNNVAHGPASFFRVASPVSSVQSPFLPIRQLGNVKRPVDNIQAMRYRK